MFKIGQKIVCRNDSGKNRLVKGKIYTINSFCFCSTCGIKKVVLAECLYSIPSSCPCGNVDKGVLRYVLTRFEPLKYDLISNKDIIKNIVEEKQDIEIKKLIPEESN